MKEPGSGGEIDRRKQIQSQALMQDSSYLNYKILAAGGICIIKGVYQYKNWGDCRSERPSKGWNGGSREGEECCHKEKVTVGAMGK